jgi:hypothetical protein
MTSMRDRKTPLLGAVLASVVAPAFAQSGNAVFTGSASIGARSVDLSGTETKFKEDINLDDGVRIFGVNLRYEPAATADARVDRLELDAAGLGGDPFETVHFGVRKYGAYDLRLDRRRSQYFYEDTILPAAVASIAGSTGGDFHHFDFERVRDTANLDIAVSPETHLSFGLEHQTRSGESTTTLAIERDEFELDKPLDESLNALTFGIRHSWDRVTVIFDERLGDFENTSEVFLPGSSPGQNTTDLAELHFFRLDQSYDYGSRSHAVRVLAKPMEALDLKVGWRREDLDLDMQAEERSEGVAFDGVPFANALSGPAVVSRDLEIGDVEAGYLLNERVRLIGGVRRSTLVQQGMLAFGPDLGAGTWDIATDGYDVGIEVALTGATSLATGWSNEARAVTSRWLLGAAERLELTETERDGFFARLAFSAEGGLAVTASIEDNSIDDPFALASPTSSRRYRAGVTQRWDSGWSLAAGYRRTDVDNDLADWAADTEQADVRLGYRRERLDLSMGYTSIDVAREIDQLVVAGTRTELIPIAYVSDAGFTDFSARWRTNARLALGGEVRAYDNRGSFRLSRDDLHFFIEAAVGSDYVLQASYRNVDYAEDAYDAYDAGILELALRLNW